MFENRGINRNSFITGPSTRNQRIERLWKDVRSNVLNFYGLYFSSLELMGLNFSNLRSFYVVHYLYQELMKI